MKPAAFGAFWHGPLDPLTSACLASFPAAGLDLRLYAYDRPAGLPPGVQFAEAREIEPDVSLVGRYIALGKVSFAKFSNLFRYRMIRKTGLCWVDADVLCLRAPDLGEGEIVFGRQAPDEHPGAIGSAVLMTPRDHPILQDLVDEASRVVDVDQPWGVIGPRLLTAAARRHGLDGAARPREAFYPVHWERFLDPFAPDCVEAVRIATATSSFLHLWNELLVRADYDRAAFPPPGSFLNDALRERNLERGFCRTCSVEELDALRQRWSVTRSDGIRSGSRGRASTGACPDAAAAARR